MTSHGTPAMASDNYGTIPQSPSASRDVVEPDETAFSILPAALVDMIMCRSLAELQRLGGARGLAKGFLTNLSAGLSIDEPFQARKFVFGTNALPDRKVRSVFQLMLEALSDKTLILLCIVAAISLALGLDQSIALPHKPGEPRVEWVDGVTIMVAVTLVVVVGALNDYQKERQLARLNKKKENNSVRAVRSGKHMEISVHDVLAGDLLHLEPGDIVPTDGVLISGYGLRLDESFNTGESEQTEKTPVEEALAHQSAGQDFEHGDPFVVSGSKVLEGIGVYLVTGVGVNSIYGRLGAVTLALAIASVRMSRDSNLVHVLAACETMGSATTVCCDKTGTLTMNNMRVTARFFDLGSRFAKEGFRAASSSQSDSDDVSESLGTQEVKSSQGFTAAMSVDVREILVVSIAINSTAFEGEEDGKPVYIGSKTVAVILTFAKDQLGMQLVYIERANANVVYVFPFNSTRKCMACVVRLDSNTYRMYVKGAPEVLLERSSQIVFDCSDLDPSASLTGMNRSYVLDAVAGYADQALRTLAFAY